MKYFVLTASLLVPASANAVPCSINPLAEECRAPVFRSIADRPDYKPPTPTRSNWFAVTPAGRVIVSTDLDGTHFIVDCTGNRFFVTMAHESPSFIAQYPSQLNNALHNLVPGTALYNKAIPVCKEASDILTGGSPQMVTGPEPEDVTNIPKPPNHDLNVEVQRLWLERLKNELQ